MCHLSDRLAVNLAFLDLQAWPGGALDGDKRPFHLPGKTSGDDQVSRFQQFSSPVIVKAFFQDLQLWLFDGILGMRLCGVQLGPRIQAMRE